ncbi:hypothetical protein H8959_013599 [Pygathrix nigripes]
MTEDCNKAYESYELRTMDKNYIYVTHVYSDTGEVEAVQEISPTFVLAGHPSTPGRRLWQVRSGPPSWE